MTKQELKRFKNYNLLIRLMFTFYIVRRYGTTWTALVLMSIPTMFLWFQNYPLPWVIRSINIFLVFMLVIDFIVFFKALTERSKKL